MELRDDLARRIERREAILSVIGLGYVGIPLACAFAAAGFRVRGLDIDPVRIRLLAAGGHPLDPAEPGLDRAVSEAVTSGRMTVATDPSTIRDADVHLIVVDTPIDGDGRPDARPLQAACATAAAALRRGTLVVVESTVAPGTMDAVVRSAVEAGSGLRVEEDVFLGHCPERVMPGVLLRNIRSMSRVCGGSSPATAELVAALYRHVVSAELTPTDLLTAETVKTAENAWYDVNIAFANEVALICEAIGADAARVRELVNRSPGRNMLVPGSGVGGACIPKDPWLLVAAAPTVEARLIRAARGVNDSMPTHVARLVREALTRHGRAMSEARIAILGAAYRPDTRDDRNSPTAPLVRSLRADGAEVRVHDPYILEHRRALADIAAGADAAVVMVAHQEYRRMDLVALRGSMRTPVLVDGRRAIDAGAARSAGFTYLAVGRPPAWS